MLIVLKLIFVAKVIVRRNIALHTIVTSGIALYIQWGWFKPRLLFRCCDKLYFRLNLQFARLQVQSPSIKAADLTNRTYRVNIARISSVGPRDWSLRCIAEKHVGLWECLKEYTYHPLYLFWFSAYLHSSKSERNLAGAFKASRNACMSQLCGLEWIFQVSRAELGASRTLSQLLCHCLVRAAATGGEH